MSTQMQFHKATKAALKARIALIGPSGSGKTLSALKIAQGLGGRIAVIDTENGTASVYSDEATFDVLRLDTFSPETYVEAIHAAEQAGYQVLIIDSLSHAWMGKDGALEQVDRAAARSHGNSFGAWREVTPRHNALVDALVRCKCHLIVTMRAKTEYVQEKDPNGKTVVRKIGLAPIQRDGLEYEFDVAGDMDANNRFIVTKSRMKALNGKVIDKPGPELGQQILAWLQSDGTPAPTPVPSAEVRQPERPQPGEIPVPSRLGGRESGTAHTGSSVEAPSRPTTSVPSKGGEAAAGAQFVPTSGSPSGQVHEQPGTGAGPRGPVATASPSTPSGSLEPPSGGIQPPAQTGPAPAPDVLVVAKAKLGFPDPMIAAVSRGKFHKNPDKLTDAERQELADELEGIATSQASASKAGRC